MHRIDGPGATVDNKFTEGDPVGGVQATVVTAPWLNDIQENLMAVLTAAGVSPTKGRAADLLDSLKKVAVGQTGSGSRVSGLTGNNNSGTPASQFDFSALSVTVRNPITGATAVINNPGSLTNNLLTAGPVANGRDQAGAFAASTWVHFYYIWNGTTIATISSTAQPTAGPTLPSGYTSWAYIGAVYFGAGSALANGNFRGSWFSYQGAVNAVTSGTSTSLVGVPVPTLVPPNALQFEVGLPTLSLTSSAGGSFSVTCTLVLQGSTVVFSFGQAGTTSASTAVSFGGTYKRVSNIGQNFAYQIVVGAGSGASVSISIPGYSVPNGGE